MRLTENFILEEFNCKDGTKVPKEYINNVLRLAQELQKLRAYIKEPIIIISGYRTKEYNIRVGGKIQSASPAGQKSKGLGLKTMPNN